MNGSRGLSWRARHPAWWVGFLIETAGWWLGLSILVLYARDVPLEGAENVLAGMVVALLLVWLAVVPWFGLNQRLSFVVGGLGVPIRPLPRDVRLRTVWEETVAEDPERVAAVLARLTGRPRVVDAAGRARFPRPRPLDRASVWAHEVRARLVTILGVLPAVAVLIVLSSFVGETGRMWLLVGGLVPAVGLASLQDVRAHRLDPRSPGLLTWYESLPAADTTA